MKNFELISNYFGSELIDVINYSDGWILLKFEDGSEMTVFTIDGHLKAVNPRDGYTLIGVNESIQNGSDWHDEFDELLKSGKFGVSWNSYETCIDAQVEMWENNYYTKEWYNSHMLDRVIDASNEFKRDVKFDPSIKMDMVNKSYQYFPNENYPEVLSTSWGDRFTDISFNVRDFNDLTSFKSFDINMI